MGNIIIRCDRCGLDFESSKRHAFVDFDDGNAKEITRLCDECFVDHYLAAGYSLDQVKELVLKIGETRGAPPGIIAKLMREIAFYRHRQHYTRYLADKYLVLDVAKKPLSS